MIKQRTSLPTSLKVASLSLLWFMQLLSALPANALNPNLQMTQYAHSAWRLQEGTLPVAPAVLEQTRDGYMWLASADGLMRFDGVRFSPWQPKHGQQLPSDYIHSLLADRDGSLWIGTGIGIAHLSSGDITTYPQVDGVVETIIQDHDGNIWFTRAQFKPGTTPWPLCEVQAKSLRCFGVKEGLPLPYADALAEDSQGFLLVGSDTTLMRWKAGTSQRVAPAGLAGTTGQYGLSSVLVDSDGSTWVGMYRAGNGLGLQHVVGGKWTPIKLPEFDSSTIAVTSLFKDREGSLWIGTLNKGIIRIYGNHVDHYSSSDGLSADYVSQLGEDKEGDVWVLTEAGMDRFHALPVTSYTEREGMLAPVAASVFASNDGAIWMGNSSGIDILKNGNVTHLTTRDGLPGKIVASVFQDHGGAFWLSVDDQLVLYDGKRKFITLKKADGQPVGSYGSITEDVAGTVWLCTSGSATSHLFRVRDYQVQEVMLPQTNSPVYSVGFNAEGGVWLGLENGDLASYKDGRLTRYPLSTSVPRASNGGISPARNIVTEPDGTVLVAETAGLMVKRGPVTQYLLEENGLPCDGFVTTFQEDLRGTLYLYMNCAVVSMTASEMDRWWHNPTSKVAFKFYDRSDGARAGRTYNSPSAARTPDGRLWFATSESVLQMIDPEHLAFNTIKPPVVIESLVDDGRAVPIRDSLRLNPHLGSLRLDYTALSYAAPQKMNFRYRLEGHDADWQDAGTRRQAFYNDLPPGPYRFHVIASNNDGVWNEDGAYLSFYVNPTFYQRIWFKLLLGVSLLGALWLLYRYRVYKATEGVRIRLMERLTERERIARDLHDTFFQGIQGLLLRFNTGTNQLEPDAPARPIFIAALEQSDQVMLEGRKLVLDLRETNEFAALEDSLAQVGDELRTQYPVSFNLTVLGTRRDLQPGAARELYSLGREALYNAFRHSHADLIELELDYSVKHLVLKVRDDGDGMSEDVLRDKKRAGHWGLPGMYERADKLGGTLILWSRAGNGTEIEVSVPAETVYCEESRSFLPEWLVRLFRPGTSVAG